MNYTAEVIAVGTEILLGNIANTDAQDVSMALSELGINVFYHSVVGDNPQRVKDALEIAKSRANIIITTGGLGPTYDDLTKQTLAQCFDKELYYDEESAETIKELFETKLHGAEMTENNMLQAYLPEGCTVFHNSCGTAPGCGFESGGIHVLMLPGPPSECRQMLKTGAIPYLKRLSEVEIKSHNIHIFGMGESSVEARLHELMTHLDNPTLAPYAKDGEVMLRVTARAESDEQAEEMMEPVIQQVQHALGDIIYGIDSNSLEESLVKLLIEKKLTIATAESCTGGLVSKRITDVPGASKAYLGGVVSYSNSAKADILGVDPKMLEEHGAVSKQVAMAMAQGARDRLGTDLGVSLTGIAGPDSDGTDKPVGLVYIGFASKDGVSAHEVYCGSPRAKCRTMAANYALDIVRRQVCGLPMLEKFL